MYHLELFELSSSCPTRLHVKAGSRIRVRSGVLWLTVQGSLQDIWLHAGQEWCAPHDLTAWISAEAFGAASTLHGEIARHAQPLSEGWGRGIPVAVTGISAGSCRDATALSPW